MFSMWTCNIIFFFIFSSWSGNSRTNITQDYCLRLTAGVLAIGKSKENTVPLLELQRGTCAGKHRVMSPILDKSCAIQQSQKW